MRGQATSTNLPVRDLFEDKNSIFSGEPFLNAKTTTTSFRQQSRFRQQQTRLL
jgi:hypothetical protein